MNLLKAFTRKEPQPISRRSNIEKKNIHLGDMKPKG
jgi:hypothetical protein